VAGIGGVWSTFGHCQYRLLPVRIASDAVSSSYAFRWAALRLPVVRSERTRWIGPDDVGAHRVLERSLESSELAIREPPTPPPTPSSHRFGRRPTAVIVPGWCLPYPSRPTLTHWPSSPHRTASPSCSSLAHGISQDRRPAHPSSTPATVHCIPVPVPGPRQPSLVAAEGVGSVSCEFHLPARSGALWAWYRSYRGPDDRPTVPATAPRGRLGPRFRGQVVSYLACGELSTGGRVSGLSPRRDEGRRHTKGHRLTFLGRRHVSVARQWECWSVGGMDEPAWLAIRPVIYIYESGNENSFRFEITDPI
jgi:hypothetical protein